jgi:hypothetical protein
MTQVTLLWVFGVLCGYLLGRIHENEHLAGKARRGS